MQETMTVPGLHATIEIINGYAYPVHQYTVTGVPVSVDDAALLASEGMGGPTVNFRWSSARTSRGGLFTGYPEEVKETWQLVIVAFIPDELNDVLDFLNWKLMAQTLDLQSLRYRQWRFRGGELVEDTLAYVPVKG